MINARFASPIDYGLLEQAARECNGRIITLEEGCASGGFGEGCRLAMQGITEVESVAMPHEFLPHGEDDVRMRIEKSSVQRIINSELGRITDTAEAETDEASESNEAETAKESGPAKGILARFKKK